MGRRRIDEAVEPLGHRHDASCRELLIHAHIRVLQEHVQIQAQHPHRQGMDGRGKAGIVIAYGSTELMLPKTLRFVAKGTITHSLRPYTIPTKPRSELSQERAETMKTVPPLCGSTNGKFLSLRQ